ncbi:DUF4157 domain-containing protein [Streptomyces sp. NBC_01446]|uniref:eCIS core domain-containing protein n=1 Tax=Streptomyces sp. NBC_01446 TaxID=2903870 RepID=UPI00224C8EF2|nr:DUF4157 domain-containing protein [Streptomyces sp. NBC_01446]MCX4642468.1 DUF4157 domain-containing protein [Streptomyces sp. NBC_01446]
MSSRTQDARAEQAAEQRRRQRKERAAKSRAPEPKNIVSGAGQPLDPGLRRELEEQLGHDLGRIRLHTGRDAGQLTELLGADAVAVGQDVFFREGAYRPGTDEGRRLLTHELQHTVQNPHGLGALRAGRELGAVSLPQQAIEREAEAAAQAVVQPGALEQTPQVEEGQATPGWLRYATVDADRMRAEAVDPATLVDRLAGNVLRSLRGDPTDASGRVRLQLARMSEELEDAVVDRLENRLLTPEYDRLLEIADQARPGPVELQPAETPLPETDLFEALGVERTQWQKKQESDRRSGDRRADDTREEQQNAKTRDEKSSSNRSRVRSDAATEEQDSDRRTEQEDERNASRQQAKEEQQQTDEQAAGDRERTDQAADQHAQGQQAGTEQAKEERKEQRDREEADPRQASAPGTDKRKERDDQTQPGAGSKSEEPDPKQKAQPGPVRPEKADERAEQPDSALSEHGLNEKDEDGGPEAEPREEERPLGLEAGADQEVAGGEDEGGRAPGAEQEPAIKPEDYLPEADLDLSAVPTADKLAPGAAEPSLPSFPAPPPTKAEKIEQEREKRDQEADEDAAGPEQRAPGQDEGPVEGEAPQPENGPAAQAQDRGTKDLQETDKPLDQEVGQDPATQDKEQPEAEAEKPDPEQQQEKEQNKEPESAEGDRTDDDEKPDAEDAEAEKSEQRERTAAESRTTAGSPSAAAPTVVSPVAAAVSKPAGAQTPKTPVEDRDPSPAARRGAEPPRSEREAPQAKSQVPKESGPGAAPRGPVGAAERTGPTTAAGPGAAPSVTQAAVSPAAEQSDGPGQTASDTDAPRPEASLEKDGGGCAPPAPAPEKDEGGQGGCGGGGGEAAPEQKQEDPPDVSGQDPKAAVQTVSRLAPDQAAAAMPGVDRAADRKIGEEQQRLDAAPPTRERPSGAPQTRSAPPEAAPEAAQVTGKVERIGPEDQGDKQKAKGGDKAEGKEATADVPPPAAPAVPDKGLSEAEAKNVEAAADAVPTTDPELENKTVGPAPKIRLEGASDPTRTDDQAKALKDKQSDLQTTGREDAAKPLGEDQIFPNAPAEQLRGKASGGAGGGKAGALEATPAPKAGVGAVAKQEKGTEITGGAGKAQGDLDAKDKEHQQSEQQAKQDKQTEINSEVERNTAQQTAERGRVAQETRKQREDWRGEQDKKVEDADKQSDDEHGKKNKEIVKARDDKDKEVGERKDKDNASIDTERENAEKEAQKKKEEKKKPSGGLFGWIADKVADFFKGLLAAVTAVFDAARKAVNGIIDQFKEWANQAIEFVRDLAIKAINALADVLIAIGDKLLAAFPELRDRFRKAIEGLRDAAIAKVNQLADSLKKAVNALLDALAAGLNKLLDVLEAGVKAVIKAYQAIIVGAIKFAQAAIEALGKFAALVADIAPDPGGWISKAGSSAKTGITDHLWGAIKVAVKGWFDTKVEGILGLGKAVIDVLVKGCVSIKQIGKMAWDAIIASLPMMIATLVIEKVVSMIVPAAGAILTIIQGLMAAWSTVSSILSAFGKFWAYLKAVKAGPAACLFAEAVAAGVVALLDFITNFLLQKLSSATKGVGKRLKGMAQKIMDGLKKVGGGAKKAAGAAVNSARGAMRRARQRLGEPGIARKPKGEPSPDLKSPVKSKDGASPKAPPKSPPKTDPAATKPKDTKSEPANGKSSADKDTKPQTSTKKEIEGPKPTRPRKPKSPAAKTLAKAKGAVKSALKKVGNAAKTLGRKLKKSKVGKALKNGASKLRNLFKKKKDRLRDHKRDRASQKRRQEDQKKRKKEQNHDERLAKAVARMRPILKVMLRKGVPPRILNATLTAMRSWYRLSRVAASAGRKFTIQAWASPPQIVVPGTSVTIEPREALAFIRELSAEVRGKSAAKKDLSSPAQDTRDEETGKVTKVTANEGSSFGELTSYLDDLETEGAFPRFGDEKGTREKQRKDPATGKKVGTGEHVEYDMPGSWGLEFEGEGGGVTMHEMAGGVNTVAHMRQEGQVRGDAPPYSKFAAREGVHGYAYLEQLGGEYLKAFRGDRPGRQVSELERNKMRTLMTVTGYSEKRRDESSRVYSAMLAKLLARGAARGDSALIKNALEAYPVAPPGAQKAIPSKDAWVGGKSKEDQLKELVQRYEEKLDAANTKDEQKDLRKQRGQEKLGIAGAPNRKKPLIGGEDLAEREARYIQMFLSGYTFDFSDDMSPEKVKQDVFEKIRQEILDAHGLN